jgi:serine/threonine protein kinase
VVGTAAYLAPEQARGEETTPAADVYALGVVLYQLLTGRLPWEGSTLAELAIRRENESPLPPTSYDPDVPETLSRAVLRSLGVQLETPTYLLVDTVLTYAGFFLAGVLYHLAAKIVRGRGALLGSLVAFLYLTPETNQRTDNHRS